MNSSFHRRAFSLIELLVVVAIILTLAGLTIGAASYVGRRAKIEQAKAEVSAMVVALEMYKADNGAYPPLDARAFNGATASIEGRVLDSFPNGMPVTGSGKEIVYFAPNPVYPFATTTNGWTNSQFIFRALTAGPKIYMSFRSNQIATVQSLYSVLPNPAGVTNYAQVILDPWGVPYGYQPTSPRANPSGFDLWSAGPDNACSNAFYDGEVVGYYFTPANDDITNWAR